MLHADLTAEARPLIKLLAAQPLQTLSLSGSLNAPALKIVINEFDLSTLQFLQLSRYGALEGQLVAQQNIVGKVIVNFVWRWTLRTMKTWRTAMNW